MKRPYADSVRNDLEHYARLVDDNARATERYTVALVRQIEELNGGAARPGRSLEDMKADYTTLKGENGFELVKKTEILGDGAFLSLASGCQRVALTPDVMSRLESYERIKPAMLRMYDEVENIDGVFLFDLECNSLVFRSEYRLEDSFDAPGMDLQTIFDLGIIYHDWFRTVDREDNPARRALWSPTAFIAVEHDWIMNLSAPIYRNRYAAEEKMIGSIGVHYNLDWMAADTIEKSAVKMMIVKDDSTLIGLNSAAKREIKLETFDKKKFVSMNGLDPRTTREKKKFVNETMNLAHGKGEDVTSLALKLKSEFQFRHSLFGNGYTVIREKAPELGLNFVALLDDSG
jgi:hypothetical protein